MANVVLTQLTKVFAQKNGPDFTALKGIDLEIREGELMVLVGPSGCGKSTALRLIAGLEEVSSGTVAIDGRVVNDVQPKDRDIAMVFQNYALYPHLSVYENMAFALNLRKLPKAEIETRVRETAELLQIEHLLDRKPKALSGGQRQRVAVGRAIVRKPKVFLFDEPLSNLDAKMRASTRAEIARLHARLGTTMIYVTHDQVEAMTLGTRICVLRDGKIMQVAEPLELYHRPANQFVAGFIGSPPMNFFPGKISRDGERLRFVGSGAPGLTLPLPTDALSGAAASAADGRPVVLGIRPENVQVGPTETAGSTDAQLAATVEFSEHMGSETHLHLAAGACQFKALLRPPRLLTVGETVKVGFDLRQAHLFDATTEQALRSGTV